MSKCINCPFSNQLRHLINVCQILHNKVWDDLILEKEFNLLQGTVEIDQLGDALDSINLLRAAGAGASWLKLASSLPSSDIHQGKKGPEPKKPMLTEEEVRTICEIMMTTDGGCNHCAYDLLIKFGDKFPAFQQFIIKACGDKFNGPLVFNQEKEDV